MLNRLRPHLTYANVMVTALAFIALGGTTLAATGGNFILGQPNSASSTTGLSAGTTGPALRATNTSTGTAGSFNVTAGHAPFTVNSGTKVTNLNADKLDGLDSTSFISNSSLRRVGPIVAKPLDGQQVTVPIATIGHFSFAGGCDRNFNGQDRVQTFISSDVAGSAFGSITHASAGTAFGQPGMAANTYYRMADGISPAGSTLAFNPVLGSALEAPPYDHEVIFNLYQGMNARVQGGWCVFGGTFTVK
jgi:hypothetical protein